MSILKKTKHMLVDTYEPPVKKKPAKVKGLNPEMAIRTKNALKRMLDDGDLTQVEFDALWAKTLARVKAEL